MGDGWCMHRIPALKAVEAGEGKVKGLLCCIWQALVSKKIYASRLTVVAYTCNHSNQEVEAGESRVKDQPPLCGEFKTRLGPMRLCLKIKKIHLAHFSLPSEMKRKVVTGVGKGGVNQEWGLAACGRS